MKYPQGEGLNRYFYGLLSFRQISHDWWSDCLSALCNKKQGVK